MKIFIEDLPERKELLINRNEEEIVLEKPSNTRQKEVKDDTDEDLKCSLNFGGMQKAGTRRKEVHITHNDLDLHDFQKMFVRKKKNIKFEKFRTEEHSDGEDSTSSSDEDSDTVIAQG